MQIIQIVPRLPPVIDGVGDYSFLLAKQLRAAHGIHTRFVVCDTQWGKAEGAEGKSEIGNRKSEMKLDGFPIHQIKERSAEELLRVLSLPGMPTTVLLQYVGYGYQPRGCPVWLVRALQEWKSAKENAETLKTKNLKFISECQNASISDFKGVSPQRQLLTMFHEVSASGPVWSSAFWTSPVQRWIAKSLARLSDHCITNLNICAHILQKLTSRSQSDFTVLPVFSNMGEPEQLPDWNGREPRMVVFGRAGERRKVYFEHKADLEKACAAMGLEEVVDIGAAVEIPQLSVRVIKRGILPAPDVSREMLTARAGFFAYPAPYLGKSTIFAAYAAHGLVPVTFDENRMENEDGLKFGECYLSTNKLNGCDIRQIATLRESVYHWYQRHDLKAQANAFSSVLDL